MRIATHTRFVVMVPGLLLCAWAASAIHRPAALSSPAAIARPSHTADAARMPTVSPLVPQQENTFDEGAINGAVDLYGNETTDAVARYNLDAEGSLYELHSPRTELLRLGSPKS
jgi:hypothetical protein